MRSDQNLPLVNPGNADLEFATDNFSENLTWRWPRSPANRSGLPEGVLATEPASRRQLFDPITERLSAGLIISAATEFCDERDRCHRGHAA
jgi:hypothetical protein